MGRRLARPRERGRIDAMQLAALALALLLAEPDVSVGAQAPTFTVYKLDKPMRVVIDVASATLDEAVRGHESGATWTPGAWAVSQISAQDTVPFTLWCAGEQLGALQAADSAPNVPQPSAAPEIHFWHSL